MEFATFFKFSHKVLRIIGLDLFEDWEKIKTPKDLVISVFKKCFYWFTIVSFALGCVSSTVFSYNNFSNLELSSDATFNVIVLIVTMGKAINLWRKRTPIIEMLTDLKTEFNSWARDKEVEKIIQKSFKSFDRFQKFYAIVLVMVDMLFALDPLSAVIQNGFEDYKFPHPVWVPFDITNTYSYVSVYIFLEYLSVGSSMFMLGTDLPLNGLIVVLSLEFDILAKDFDEFNTDLGCKRMKQLIDRHDKLLKISEKLESTFNISNLFVFVGSSLLMSFPAFQVVSSGENFVVLKFFFLFLMGLLQTFLLCNYGEKLRSSSLRVAEKAMNCDWWDCDHKELKDGLALVLLRSQKPVELTALKFTAISIETFSKVRLKNSKNFYFNLCFHRYCKLHILTSLFS